MGERTVTATVSDDRTIHGPNNQKFGPGDEFVGPVTEVRRLRALGYLVDPRRMVVPHGAQRGALLVIRD
jgi:hypothetical protein